MAWCLNLYQNPVCLQWGRFTTVCLSQRFVCFVYIHPKNHGFPSQSISCGEANLHDLCCCRKFGTVLGITSAVLYKQLIYLSTSKEGRLMKRRWVQLQRDARNLDRFQMFLVAASVQFLYLDADNTPLQDPSNLFEWPVFKTEGNVFWPDYMGPGRHEVIPFPLNVAC